MNDRTLRSYLLGRLAPDDAAAVEEHLLGEEDVLEAMRAVEDDLFDEYARGRLTAEERRQFLARYGSQHDRLVFAHALARRVPRTGGVLRRGWTGRRWLALAAAATLVLSLGGALWLVRGRDRAAAIAANPPARRSVPVAPAAPPVVALLTLGISRDTGRPPQVVVPPGATTIEWRVRLDPNDRFERYSMELRGPADVVVWRADDRHASAEGGDFLLVGRAPAAGLADGAYELAVRGLRPNGPPEDLGFVTVQVTRTP